MSRPSGVFKNDSHALEAWGNAYKSIPKSVFATVAWHLANLVSDHENANQSFLDELMALADNGIIPKQQALNVLKSIERSIS